MSEPKQVEKVSLHTADHTGNSEPGHIARTVPGVGEDRWEEKLVQCQSSSHGKIVSL